jgi:hypothetical protein
MKNEYSQIGRFICRAKGHLVSIDYSLYFVFLFENIFLGFTFYQRRFFPFDENYQLYDFCVVRNNN